MASTSSAVKAIFTRSTTADVNSRRRKGTMEPKFWGNQIDLLNSSGHFSRNRCRRACGGITRCRDSGMLTNGLGSNQKAKKQEAPLPSRAVLTPVSDPAATDKKVNFSCFTCYTLTFLFSLNYNFKKLTSFLLYRESNLLTKKKILSFGRKIKKEEKKIPYFKKYVPNL